MTNPPEGYGKDYSETGFWDKVLGYARSAGRDVVEKALQLFYAAQAPATPLWAKTVIYGALGYFINILDAIPDFTPAVGYADDLGVLVAALATVAACITPEIEERARTKVGEWFDPAGTPPAHGDATPRRLVLYGRRDCPLCEEMRVALEPWPARLGFQLDLVDIESDEVLERRYGFKVPVLAEGDEEICHHFLDEHMLMRHFGADGE